jgi:hypothetical protein
MEKVIEIPDEIVIDLKVMAAKENKDLKRFLKDLLVRIVNESRNQQKTN